MGIYNFQGANPPELVSHRTEEKKPNDEVLQILHLREKRFFLLQPSYPNDHYDAQLAEI
jgi:hypothetical protein